MAGQSEIRQVVWRNIILWSRRHSGTFAHYDVDVNSSRLRYLQIRGRIAHVGNDPTPPRSARGCKRYRLAGTIDPWQEDV